jgi:hypothetical protein
MRPWTLSGAVPMTGRGAGDDASLNEILHWVVVVHAGGKQNLTNSTSVGRKRRV